MQGYFRKGVWSEKPFKSWNGYKMKNYAWRSLDHPKPIPLENNSK